VGWNAYSYRVYEVCPIPCQYAILNTNSLHLIIVSYNFSLYFFALVSDFSSALGDNRIVQLRLSREHLSRHFFGNRTQMPPTFLLELAFIQPNPMHIFTTNIVPIQILPISSILGPLFLKFPHWKSEH
jgi:hypothetical protein